LLAAIFICGVSCSSESSESVESSLLGCMERHLHSLGATERGHRRNYYFARRNVAKNTISENSTATSVDTICDTALEGFRESFYNTMTEELKDDKDMEESAECMIAKLKELNIADISMKRFVIEKTKKMSKRKRKKALRGIDHVIEKKMEIAVAHCTNDEVFGKLFDYLYEAANETTDSSEEDENSPVEDYCTRKYIIDNNFINTTVFKVNINPNNTDISKVNCDQVVLDAIEESEGEFKQEYANALEKPSKKKTKCIGKTVRLNQFFENTVVVILYGEIGIPEDIKAAEKTNFVGKMKRMSEDISKC